MQSKLVRAMKGGHAKADRQLEKILLQCGRYYQSGETIPFFMGPSAIRQRVVISTYKSWEARMRTTSSQLQLILVLQTYSILG